MELKWIPRISREILTMVRARFQRSERCILGFIPREMACSFWRNCCAFL